MQWQAGKLIVTSHRLIVLPFAILANHSEIDFSPKLKSKTLFPMMSHDAMYQNHLQLCVQVLPIYTFPLLCFVDTARQFMLVHMSPNQCCLPQSAVVRVLIILITTKLAFLLCMPSHRFCCLN